MGKALGYVSVPIASFSGRRVRRGDGSSFERTRPERRDACQLKSPAFVRGFSFVGAAVAPQEDGDGGMGREGCEEEERGVEVGP